MRIVHLLASSFYGGPERQVLGLARFAPCEVHSHFLSFPERGTAATFLDEAKRFGFDGTSLTNNTPHFFACVQEVTRELRRIRADLLCCSGYKPDLVGWRAARRVGIPVVSISHGWTSATWKVRCYERLDKIALRWMDAVMCVSNSQALKVARSGVPQAKIVVIKNAVGEEAFCNPQMEIRQQMLGWFAKPPRWIVGAAGRLSPEKGFSDYIKAAATVAQQQPDVGFVLFGDGPLRADLAQLISRHCLSGRFILAGFRKDLSIFLPNLDLNVMSSYTEGLPVALLEAGAAGVATVASAVGGVPEVINDGQSGYLIPAGNTTLLARRIVELLENDPLRRAMGRCAHDRVRSEFLFQDMSLRYHERFHDVVNRRPRAQFA